MIEFGPLKLKGLKWNKSQVEGTNGVVTHKKMIEKKSKKKLILIENSHLISYPEMKN